MAYHRQIASRPPPSPAGLPNSVVAGKRKASLSSEMNSGFPLLWTARYAFGMVRRYPWKMAYRRLVVPAEL
jgi:hypothetical protein